jgi:hypothetical protein
MERGQMPTHLRCHRHLAEDESALAETSVSAAGFSSPHLPVRRSCMGLLRTENDNLFFQYYPRNPRNWGFTLEEREKKRADALWSAGAILIRATSEAWSADGSVAIASSPMSSSPSCEAPRAGSFWARSSMRSRCAMTTVKIYFTPQLVNTRSGALPRRTDGQLDRQTSLTHSINSLWPAS